MFKNWKLKIGIEVLAWLLTGLIVLFFLLPITRKVYQYPFLQMNIIFIVITLTLVRYIFLLKYTFIGHSKWWFKALLMTGCIPAFIFTLRMFKSFQEFLGDVGVESFLKHLPHLEMVGLGKYVSAEMLFFGVSALICIFSFAFRMLISIWRLHNRGTV